MKKTPRRLKRVADYFPTRDDNHRMSKCVASGITVYPVCQEKGKKHPKVKLVININGRIKISKQPAFEQKYLGHAIHTAYKALYERFKLDKK